MVSDLLRCRNRKTPRRCANSPGRDRHHPEGQVPAVDQRYKPDAPVCSIDGCGRRIVARGWCGSHYNRWLEFRDPLGGKPIRPRLQRGAGCEVSGCPKPLHGSRFCDAHYKRWAKYGDPEGCAPSRPPRICAVEGCSEIHFGLGLCRRHYSRFNERGGDPSVTVAEARRRDVDSFVELAVHFEGDECLEWPFTMSGGGYGVIQTPANRSTSAHRYVLQLVVGPPPERSMVAAHAPEICHNRACVNPRHLRWATPTENAMDKVIDDTHHRGERNPGAKLTTPDVLAIRADPRPLDLIALDYGISVSHVWSIATRKAWAWLPDDERSAG